MPTFLKRRSAKFAKPEIDDAAQRILHRVGFALVVFGLIDIGVMVYCIVNGLSYSSSFNLFAVISGIYIWRGHPWYVKWVTRAAGFYAAAFCTVGPIVLLLIPKDLAGLELRLHPGAAVTGTMTTFGVVMFLIWVYRELRQPSVLEPYTAAGHSPGRFWTAPLYGAALALGIGVIYGVVMHGDTARKVVELAAAKAGPGSRFFVTRLSYSGDSGTAVVLAYDDRTTKTIEVAW